MINPSTIFPASSASTRETTIYASLRHHAHRIPAATAIIAPGYSPLTYARLLECVECSASTLRNPVDREGRIAIVMPNSPELIVTFLVASTVAACALLNPSDRASEFEFDFRNSNVKTLIIERNSMSPARMVAESRKTSIVELDYGGPEVDCAFGDGGAINRFRLRW